MRTSKSIILNLTKEDSEADVALNPVGQGKFLRYYSSKLLR